MERMLCELETRPEIRTEPHAIVLPRSGVILTPYSLKIQSDDSLYIGGIGITDRGFTEICSLFKHDIKETLIHELGSVVFFGNGLSTAALTLNELQRQQGIKPGPKLLVDLVNICNVEKDLDDVIYTMCRGPAKAYFEELLFKARQLLDAEKRKEVILIQQRIGCEPIEEKYRETVSIGINSNGPPYSTMEQQKEYLKKGGSLLIFEEPPVSYFQTTISSYQRITKW